MKSQPGALRGVKWKRPWKKGRRSHLPGAGHDLEPENCSSQMLGAALRGWAQRKRVEYKPGGRTFGAKDRALHSFIYSFNKLKGLPWWSSG